MCVEAALVLWYTSPTTPEEREGCKKKHFKNITKFDCKFAPKAFSKWNEIQQIFFCSMQACNRNRSIFSKPENVGKERSWQKFLKLYIHWYLIDWSVEQLMLQLPGKNCIILHIVSLSELCDAMPTKSRKVHHLDCKNRSEKCTCTSNSEVYSHKWITIFYIGISICGLRVAAQEPSFYGIRRWALRVYIGNMTKPWLLLLSGNASAICLDEMGCRPFSVFFQKPLHIIKNQVFVLILHSPPKLCFTQR